MVRLKLPFQTIRSRLILMVLGSVLPLLGLMALDVSRHRQTALDTAFQEVADYARLTAVRQSQIFDEANRLLSTLQMLPQVGVAGGPECDGLLARLSARNPRFLTMGVVRADGMIVCHNTLRRQQQFGDPEILRSALASPPEEFVVGRMIVGGVTKKLTILTARRLATTGDEQAAIVFAGIDLSGFTALAGRFDESVGKTMMVVDARAGSVVAGSGGAEAFFGKTYADHPLMAAIRAASHGGTLSAKGLGGRDEIIAVAPLRRSKLSDIAVVVSADRSAVLAAAQQATLFNLAIAALAGVIAILAAATLGHYTLAEPIVRLTAVAERVGRGDLSAKTSMKSWLPIEMRKLSRTLNHMATRLESNSRQLALLANEDGLTKLANRRRFDQALAAQCSLRERSNQALSLLLVDVDHFKSFNDTYGHLAGDDCLKRLSEQLRVCAARPGDLAARYGGEEFAIILPGADDAGAAVVARRILEIVEELAIAHRSSALRRVSVSIGSATVVSGGVSACPPDRLISLADEALYEAKSTGRAKHCARNAAATFAVVGSDGELKQLPPRGPAPLMIGKGGGRYV